MTTTRPGTAALRLHDLGEVWTETGLLTTVLYQLRIPYGAFGQTPGAPRKPAPRIEIEGTILRYGVEWETLQESPREELWLKLRDGRRIRFHIIGSAGSTALRIRGVHEGDLAPIAVPEIDR